MTYIYTSATINALESLYPDMTLRQLRILNYVLNHQGCLMMDVVNFTKLPQSVCSRTIVLMCVNAVNSKNLGLIDQVAHPTDGRKKCLYVTDKFKAMLYCIE